jgi:membrane protein insertase Oxa1/YidC/SpoIIIJ
VSLPSALSLYWLVGGLVAFIQQSIVLREDTEEMEDLADKSHTQKSSKKEIIEGEVVAKTPKKSAQKSKAKSKNRRKK